MVVSLIDTHCHLDSEGFHQDIDQVIQRATDTGVERMLTIGVDLETSQAAVLLANRYPCVSAVVGIQPNYAQEAKPGERGSTSTGTSRRWRFSETTLSAT